MEEEVYEVPKLPIGPYMKKLHEAIDQDQIRERYEDLGLEIASDRDLFDSKTELGYFLEGTLVIFQVIGEPRLLKSSDINTLVINQRTLKRDFVLALQKILFDMDPDILSLVLRQKLDELVFMVDVRSLEKARALVAEQYQKLGEGQEFLKEQERIEQALRAQIALPKFSIEHKKIVPEEKESSLEETSLPKPEKRQHRRGKERKYNHPGKKKLRQLIIKYQAKLSDIAEDPGINASKPTLSAWINNDPELKQLAEEQRRARAKKPGRPDISKIKTLDEYPGDEMLKKLIVKYRGNLRKIANDPSIRVKPAKVMNWINDSLELRRLATEQREHCKSRKTKVRVPSNPGKEILEALLINYKSDLEEMAGNLNINTDVETLRSWIKEEGLEGFVKEQTQS